jgi:hypothetical protein
MSRSLRDYLAENAAKLQAEKQKSVLRRDEWIKAVDRLRTPISTAGKIINLSGVGSPDSSGMWPFLLSDH